MTDVLVMGAAIISHGRVLVARRTHPPESAGRWELPGGKVERGEHPDAAVVREVHEELGCTIEVTGRLAGESEIRAGHVLRVATAALRHGEPVPLEHDALRWLAPEELYDVAWLEADLPFLAELREMLLDGERLPGGNVGGAVRIGRTVRRATGPWTPSVHALLDHLERRGLPHVPQVIGADERGREVLSYLPGHTVDVDTELLTEAQLASMVGWTRTFHDAVEGFEHDGPWRFFGVEEPEIVAHNDLAPYNACFQGDDIVGVFDWDLAGPSTRLLELAHLAWNGVPLWRPLHPALAARRLRVIAESYGGPDAHDILHAVPVRTQLAVDGIRTAIANGDEAMRNLAAIGEPERTEASLTDLKARIPSIANELSRHLTPQPRVTPMDQRMLLVHAHPDDESIGQGATMAKYAARGTHVTLVTCTLGEEGEVLVPELAHLASDHEDQLGQQRIGELANAMKELGVTDHRFLGGPGKYRDSGMVWHEEGHATHGEDVKEGTFWRADLTEAADHLVAVIREVRPQVMVTYDQFGGYGHPDHIQAHRVATYAASLAAVRSYRQDLGEAWDIAKIYWGAMSESRMREGLRRLREAGDTTAFQGMDPDGPLPPFVTPDDMLTARVEAGEFADAKMRAMKAHATQIALDGPFFALSNNIGNQVWGTEFYRLAEGQPGPVGEDGLETDLFAGL